MAMTTSKRLRSLAIGIGLGVYLCRLVAETRASPLSLGVIALMSAPLMAISFGIVLLANQRSVNLRPLLILYAYVLSPWNHLGLAIGVGLTALASCTIANLRDEDTARLGTIADLLIASLFLIIYIHTLSPTVLPADAGEFQLVSYVLGIAHPPGYPLYTMLAHLLTWLPVGDPAYRVNLFAAITSALTLALVNRTIRKASGSLWGGIAGAFILGSAATFWAQSTTANIRSLTALLTALSLLTITRYIQEPNERRLGLFALCFGLAVTHHSSLLLLALPFAATLLASDPALLTNPKRWPRPLLTFAIPFVILLYLPIRSLIGAPFDPAPIRSISDFLQHVLALGFKGDMLYFTTREVLGTRTIITLEILRLQLGWGLLFLATISLSVLSLRHWKLALLYGGVFLVNVLSALTYRAPQTVEYLIPAYVALVIIIGLGINEGIRHLKSHKAWAGALVGLTLLLAGTNLTHNYPSFATLSQDYSARNYAETILNVAPRNAVILSNWHYVTVFWYLQEVEALRPDVSVRYVYPEGSTSMAETTIRRVQEEISQRPVIVTNSYREYSTTPYRFMPFHGAYLVFAEPPMSLDQDLNRLDTDFSDRIHLLGYHLERDILSPGEALIVHVYWKPLVKLDRDYSFFVQVLGPDGVLGQEDITHQAARYQVGEIIVDEYHVPLLMTAPPGEYQLITGVYFTLTKGGWERLSNQEDSDHVVLSMVQVQAMQTPPASIRPMYKAFSNSVRLIGADTDSSIGGSQRLYLHWWLPKDLGDELQIAIYGAGASLATAPLRHSQEKGYITTSLDIPPHAGSLWVELRSVSTGASVPVLGPWNLPTRSRIRLPSYPADARYVPLGGQMVLTGLRYDQLGPVAGSVYRVQPTFLSQRPITNDYRVSLSLNSDGGTRIAQHDSVPAMGAIPTLKWMRGWSVTDPHMIEIPSDASGSATLRLTVYDAFTQRPLAVLDDRLVKTGQGLHIDLAIVQIGPNQQ